METRVLVGISLTTSWTLITEAAAGGHTEREEFARRYAPVVRAYLTARWKGSRLAGEEEDALQDVFVECFKQGGVLETAEARCRDGFRRYLLGVARNVARAFEGRHCISPSNNLASPSGLEGKVVDDLTPSRSFNRAWAQAILQEAAHHLEQQAIDEGPAAMRRVALLTLRFHEQLPVREIARLWNTDPRRVHVEYARARREFKRALLAVLAAHNPGSPNTAHEEWALLEEALR